MEKRFEICQADLLIPCKLTLPDQGDIRRIVLGVHGLAGCMDDDIQASIAEEMALFHAATYRFDFPAHGENTTNSLTLRNCKETLLCVARYAREQYPQIEDLCIFATGLGAYVTLLALPQLREMPGKVKLVIQTPSVRMHETLLRMINFSRETFWAMEKITFPLPRPLDVTYSFYEEMEHSNTMRNHTIPMLILQGEHDDYIPIEDLRQFRRLNELSKLVILPGISHRFMEDGAWDMVLDLTRDWFEFEQVLLTDWE